MSYRNFQSFPVLKTERLTLRQLVSSDDNEIFSLRSDENVNKYLGRQPSKSIDDARVFIQAIQKYIQANESVYWAITWHGGEKLIGTICLFDFSDDGLEAEMGFELLPNFHGQGIMQEAASTVIDFAIEQIGLNSVKAYTHSANQSSISLLDKLGFKKYSDDGENFTTYKLTTKENFKK